MHSFEVALHNFSSQVVIDSSIILQREENDANQF